MADVFANLALTPFLTYTKVANPKLRTITITQDLDGSELVGDDCDVDYVEIGRQVGIDLHMLHQSTSQLGKAARMVKPRSNCTSVVSIANLFRTKL
jgi:hypothetical protein